MKDDVLAELGARRNVAQFVSFGVEAAPRPRHVLIRGLAPHASDEPRGLVTALLAASGSGAVNVRTFRADGQRGTPFHYGLTDVAEVLRTVSAEAAVGHHTIVNELIDVEDGGVSGVATPTAIEFAPDATPRVVEEAGVAGGPPELMLPLLATVYGFPLSDIVVPGQRIEFSIHPQRVGYRHEHVIAWEADPAADGAVPALTWPNRFSRHLGDKVFGLILADVAGEPVPRATVVARRVHPFTFGRPTGSHEGWTRTSPHEPQPGVYSTVRGWVDLVRLMAQEDPDGTQLASALYQDDVDALYSGATEPLADGDVVDGVTGDGAAYMLGERTGGTLPAEVVDAVRGTLARLAAAFGRVKIEWAYDGTRVWVLQLHQVRGRTLAITDAGGPDWERVDPRDGLQAVRDGAARAAARGTGVQLTAPVGLTSHAVEVIRQAGVPLAIPRA